MAWRDECAEEGWTVGKEKWRMLRPSREKRPDEQMDSVEHL